MFQCASGNILHLTQDIIDIPTKVNDTYRNKYTQKHPMQFVHAWPQAAVADNLLSECVNDGIKCVE